MLVDQLPQVFDKLPHVVTHGDFNEMNILIDHESGRIMGIIDWAEMQILTFGIVLWAVENMLGYILVTGWEFYDDAEEFRTQFWKAFYSNAQNVTEEQKLLIEASRQIGIFLRYGFAKDGSVVGESGRWMQYLDAYFC